MTPYKRYPYIPGNGEAVGGWGGGGRLGKRIDRAFFFLNFFFQSRGAPCPNVSPLLAAAVERVSSIDRGWWVVVTEIKEGGKLGRSEREREEEEGEKRCKKTV